MHHIQDGEVAGPSRGTVIKYSGPIMTTNQENPYPSMSMPQQASTPRQAMSEPTMQAADLNVSLNFIIISR